MANQRQTELPEAVWSGPFGGIQSEMAPVQIETLGFYDLLNVILNKGRIGPRPGVNFLPVPDGNPITGMFDFFNYVGTRLTGVWTTQKMWKWNYTTSAWVQVTGTFTVSSNLFSWAVVAGKLCFCQGIDPVMLWDGVTAGFAAASVNAVPAFYLSELDNHLVAVSTIEAGSPAPQRVRWTGAGDPTDWTSFNSGQVDLFNDLGPITGTRKIYQSGYIFQEWGIVQQIPTGNGLNPFNFFPLASKSKGLYYPYSLAGYGEKVAVYVGKDNVYMFDGSASEPIGDMPTQGPRMGARSRIMSDLYSSITPGASVGAISTSSNGNVFEAYWLVIPNVSTWVFNLLEGSWTRWQWGTDSPSFVSEFFNSHQIRIIDLVGPILSQFWTFAGLASQITSVDSIGLGYLDGDVGLFDFTVLPDQPWSITGGTFAFSDTRHSKNLRRIRLVYEASTDVSFTITVTNEQGQSEAHNINVPAASGTTQTQVIPFQLPGVFLQLVINGPAGQLIDFTEIALGYDVGGEVKTAPTVT